MNIDQLADIMMNSLGYINTWIMALTIMLLIVSACSMYAIVTMIRDIQKLGRELERIRARM